MAFKCIYTFWILLLKSVPWIYIANTKCWEYFLRVRRLGSSCRVVALEHGLSCEWAPGCEADPVHSPEWWLFNNFSCPSELRALSDHTGCMSSEHKQKPAKSRDHLLSSWPLLKYFCSPQVSTDIFLSGGDGKCYFRVLTLNTMFVQMSGLWSETKVTLRSLSGYRRAISWTLHIWHFIPCLFC